MNSPFTYELWTTPGVMGPPMRLMSLKRSFRIAQDEIKPGEGRFILMDGQTYRLRQPSKKDVQFTVPICCEKRRCPSPITVLPVDADVLTLPTQLDD